MENPTFEFQPRILHANDETVRYKGSSGGVITQIIKYLFETRQINSAISFKFAGTNLFEPFIINNFNDYNQIGSIYHEINIFKYLKQNINFVRSPVVITCLPCEIITIKRLLKKHNIESFLISLVCSSQLSKNATYYFLEKNQIDIKKVQEFRYRGNGWPSGIQIKTDEKEYFFHNNNSKWLDIFHSQIFTLDKCFSCIDTFGLKADISVADPWLDRYVENDRIGSSIVIANTQSGEDTISKMLNEMKLCFDEELSYEETVLSQKGTLIKKYIYKKYRKNVKLLIKFFRTNTYKKYFYRFSKLHRWSIFKIIGILKRFEGIK